MLNNFLILGRILAIDFGTKRVGIAVSDPLQIIASGLATVQTKEVILYLEEYFKKEQVDSVVIGEPKTLDNKPSDITVEIEAFINQLKKKFPGIKIERVDERFTSKMAFQAMIDGGLGKKSRRDKALVDKISATIILQSYMERKK